LKPCCCKAATPKATLRITTKHFALTKPCFFSSCKTVSPKNGKRQKPCTTPTLPSKLLQRLHKELEIRGALDVIRNGFTDNGITFELAYFKPETSMNPETGKLYNQNILSVTRQVKYSSKNENSLDMVLFLNGLPVATVELKNQFTNQTSYNAKRQFIEDREPRELLVSTQQTLAGAFCS
jgi:type I restriction enzyme, R subunit